METDFTSVFARRPPPPISAQHHDAIMMNSPASMGTDDHCGFCTQPENCLCRDESMQHVDTSEPPTLAPLSADRATVPITLRHRTTAPSFLEAPTRASGPGTCDMCLADPEKARQCQELARSTSFSNPQQGRLASDASAAQAAQAQAHADRMSCSDFFTTAAAQHVELGPERFRALHVYPYSHRADGRNVHSPAMEIDAHDAAQALTALSRGQAKVD